jgi:hypothetical protein
MGWGRWGANFALPFALLHRSFWATEWAEQQKPGMTIVIFQSDRAALREQSQTAGYTTRDHVDELKTINHLLRTLFTQRKELKHINVWWT